MATPPTTDPLSLARDDQGDVGIDTDPPAEPGAKLGRRERREVALVLAGGVTALAAAAVVAVATDATTADLFKDPVGRASGAPLAGVMTIVGVFAWAAAAATALFRASLTARHDRLRRFLFATGALTAIASVDDLLRGHENIGHLLMDDGELLVLGLFGVLALMLMLRFRDVIRSRTPIALLAGVAVLLGFSATVDVVSHVADVVLPGHYLVEDGPKFLGILLWANYLVIVSRRATGGSPALSEPNPP